MSVTVIVLLASNKVPNSTTNLPLVGLGYTLIDSPNTSSTLFTKSVVTLTRRKCGSETLPEPSTLGI